MVKTKGSRPQPQEIMQHPMLDGPQLPVPNADGNVTPVRTVQSYLNVLSNTPIECDSDIIVMGTLEKVSLGGSPRTKGSYEGWSIRVSEHLCP